MAVRTRIVLLAFAVAFAFLWLVSQAPPVNSAPSDNTPLWIYDIGNQCNVNSVSVSSDGSYIAAGSDSGIYLFTNVDNTPVWFYDGGYSNSVSISSDGSYIVSSSLGGVIRLFTNSDNVPVWTYEIGFWCYGVSISSDGSYIAAGSLDNKVYLFTNSDNTPVWTYDTGHSVVSAISSNGSYVAAGYWNDISGYGEVYLFSNVDNTPVWATDKYPPLLFAAIDSISISSDGSHIVAGNSTGTLCIFLFTNSDNTPVWVYHTNIWGSSLSSDGSYISAAGVDHNVYLFTNSDNTPVWTYETGETVPSVSISSDGSCVAAGSEDDTIYLFTNVDNTPIWTYLTGGDVKSVSASSDGSYIAAGSGDYKVYLFGSPPSPTTTPPPTTTTPKPPFDGLFFPTTTTTRPPTTTSPPLDTDRDGWTDEEELRMGTNPYDAGSHPSQWWRYDFMENITPFPFPPTPSSTNTPVWLWMLAFGLLALLASYVYPKDEWDKTPMNEWGGARSGSWTFITPESVAVFAVAGIGLILAMNVVTPLFIAVYGLFAVTAFVLFASESRNPDAPFAFIGLGDEKAKMAVFGILLGALWLVGSGLLFDFFGISMSVGARLGFGMSMAGAGMSVLMVGIVVPLIEEPLFRAVMTPTIAEKIGLVPAFLLSGVLFGGAHVLFGASLALGISAGMFGVVLAYFMLRNQTLTFAIAAHITYNIFTVLILLLFL